jgi:hypothetical protein
MREVSRIIDLGFTTFLGDLQAARKGADTDRQLHYSSFPRCGVASIAGLQRVTAWLDALTSRSASARR